MRWGVGLMERRPGALGKERACDGLALVIRTLVLDGLRWLYHGGVVAGSAGLLALGGFVPVIRGWLRDEIEDWGGVVEALGGVRASVGRLRREGDLGLLVARADAPTLHAVVAQVARKLGARPPDQLRLAYVPCCGVVARGQTRILLLGMPLLHVLTVAELRAVLAHELAHLARGDADRSARAIRFVETLTRGLDESEGRARGPLKTWARLCHGGATVLLEPIARGQEFRADRLAATLAGGPTAASALVKVALVQPLFQEMLAHFDPVGVDRNLYAFFRAFWEQLPETLRTEMRHRLLSRPQAVDDSAHPPLLDRLALVQGYPDRVPQDFELPILDPDKVSAATTLGDPEAVEQILHDRLFSTRPVERSVFHRAGT